MPESVSVLIVPIPPTLVPVQVQAQSRVQVSLDALSSVGITQNAMLRAGVTALQPTSLDIYEQVSSLAQNPVFDDIYTDASITATHVYRGGMSGALWFIDRWQRPSGSSLRARATRTNNSSYATFAAAWAARLTLNYV